MDTVFARGFAAHRDGRLTDAERDYCAALAAEPRHVDALHYLGVLRHQQGQHAEAAELVRRAVDLRPTDAGLQLNLGNALKALGRIDDAIERFRNALTLAPGFPPAQYNLGNAYSLIGRHEDAADLFEKTLRINPDDAAAWNNFGNSLAALQKHEEASAAFRRALSLRPKHAGAHNNLGMALNALGDTLGAMEQFRAAIDAEPNYAAAHFNLGNMLDTHGHPKDALPSLEKALALQPRFAPAHFGLGHALAKLGRHRDAVPAFERAVGLDPKYGIAWLCLGNSQMALAAHRAAIRAFDQALRLDADMPAAHLNRALAMLALGDYKRGLSGYEWRLQTPGSEAAPSLPRWNGEALPHGTLVVRAEQGFGDTLQFVRFAAYARKRVGTLVLEVQPSLVPLIAPAAHAARIEVKSKSDGVRMHADAFCPLLSLPLALGIASAEAIPARAPYLIVPAEYRRKWRGSIGGQARRKIGITWSGRLQPGETRSAPVESLAPLFALEGIDWVVLQPFLTDHEREVLQMQPNAKSIHRFEGRLQNFADTAAIVDRLDAVVSVDTSVAHLAGALGKPLWVMLPFAADWRWGVDTDRTPWYPSARLVRQQAPGAWDGVMAGMVAALGE
ncbi:tetratricopeptide repeat protein [Candidatus Burkholderia verschuerenii]|nr:tetratricopeptide repeat protein [Candidatus Burkholderia verschuerenii]